MGRQQLCVSFALVAIATTGPLAAQSPDSTASHATPLFTVHDAYVGAGFIAATLALLPVDRAIARELQDSATQANRFFGGAARDLERATVPGTYIAGGL